MRWWSTILGYFQADEGKSNILKCNFQKLRIRIWVAICGPLHNSTKDLLIHAVNVKHITKSALNKKRHPPKATKPCLVFIFWGIKHSCWNLFFWKLFFYFQPQVKILLTSTQVCLQIIPTLPWRCANIFNIGEKKFIQGLSLHPKSLPQRVWFTSLDGLICLW